MFGYNDTNTYTPNPFITQGNIVLSGAGRKPMKPEDYGKMRTMDMKPEDWARLRKARGEPEYKLYGSGMDDMDGAGFFDEVKKGYSKVKKGVKSKTGQKIVGALKDDKSVMKEFNKAKKQLSDFQKGIRKSPPGKAAMIILEQSGVISKIEDEFKGAGKKSGKISRMKKAKKWRDFSEDTAYRGIDLAEYGYRKAKDAANPIAKTVRGWFGGAQGGARRGPVQKSSRPDSTIPYRRRPGYGSPRCGSGCRVGRGYGPVSRVPGGRGCSCRLPDRPAGLSGRLAASVRHLAIVAFLPLEGEAFLSKLPVAL